MLKGWSKWRKRRRRCVTCGDPVGKNDYVSCDRDEHSGVVWHFTDGCWGEHVEVWHSDEEE